VHVLQIISLSTASLSKWGEMGRIRTISGLATQVFEKQTEYDSKTTVYKQKHLICKVHKICY